MISTPNSEEAEKGVLSCMIQDGPRMRQAALELQDSHFYHPGRKHVFTAILALGNANSGVDLVTLAAELRDSGKLQAAGGPGEIADISGFAPSAAHYEYYRDILLEKWALRQILDAGAIVQRDALESGKTAKELLEAADRALTSIHAALGNHRAAATRSIRTILHECAEEVEAWQKGTRLPGLSTGFPCFDRSSLLLRPDSYFVVAAPTNTGKSTMLAQILANALHAGKRVALASIEDSAETFGHRMLSCESRVPLAIMQKQRKMSKIHFQDYALAAKTLSEKPCNVLHNGSMSCDEFRHWARRQVLDFGAEIIGLDYLQRLQPATKRGQNSETDAVNEASYTVKELSLDLGVTFVVCVQTNRLKGRKARLDDLRQSGKIEQDATEVLILQRLSDIASTSMSEDETTGESESVGTEILAMIAKQKNGPQDEHRLLLFGDHFRFEERTHQTVDALDVPRGYPQKRF